MALLADGDGILEYRHMLDEVIRTVKDHHAYRRNCLNMIASENIVSPMVSELLASDLGHRYAIGFLYKRMYRGCQYVDHIEEVTAYLAKTLFRAEHVNIVPISGTMANLVLFNALTKPGDVCMALSVLDGGHSSFRECAKVHGVSMVPLPFDADNYNVDVDLAEKMILKVKPRIVLLGSSDILFPHPVHALEQAVLNTGSILAYDSAHVLGLIAGGLFQDPLREGAQLVTGSTHKTFFGPQGGIILCRREHASSIDHSAWQLVNNHHIHRVAGLAVALCETLTFGKDYAKAIVNNSKALAEALYNRGVKVLCSHLNFTESHEVIFEAPGGKGEQLSHQLEQANIITNPMPLPWNRFEEDTSGIRLGVSELTRLGMNSEDMGEISNFIADVTLNKKSSTEVKPKVIEFMNRFGEIHYCFNPQAKAYQYRGVTA